AYIRKNRDAVLSGLQFAGRETKSCCHYQANRVNSETRVGESACAIGQGSKRFSYRSRAMGGTPGILYAVCGSETGCCPAFSKIGAVQRAYDRCSRWPHRSETN